MICLFGKGRFSLFLTLVFVIVLPTNTISQQYRVIDSLKMAINKAKHDTTRISAYISWSDELYEYNQLDSAISLLHLGLTTCNKALAAKLDEDTEEILQKQKANILINLAAFYKKKGNPTVALEILEQSLDLSKKINYKHGFAWSLYQTGDVYDYLGNLNKALALYFESLKIFQEINEEKGEGKVLNSIGTIYDYQGDLDQAMEYYNKALLVYQTINDIRGIADQLNNIGVIHHLKGDFVKALDYYFQSASINEKIISNRHVYAVTINNIGLIYDSMGDLLSALEYYNKSLDIFESLDFGSGIVMPLNNLGDTYLKQKDFDKAIEYYSRSLSVCERTDDQQGKAYTLQKICTIYIQQKEFELGDLFCEKCLDSYEKIGDKHGIALSLIAVGKLNEERGELLKAKAFYKKSLNAYEEIGDKQGKAKSLFHIGNVLFMESKFDDSFNYTYAAYNLAKAINDPNEISQSANLLSKLLRKQNDFENALKYFEEHVDIIKTIDSDEVKKLIQEQYYRLQYKRRAIADSISFAQTIEIKNLELEKKMEQTRRQRWIIFSIILGLMGFLTFSIILLRLLVSKRIAYQKLEESNIEINQQKEEITSQRDEIESQKNLLQEKNSMLEQANTEISAQRDMVISQKEKIEEVNLHITDSLRYAQSIQAAILPSEKVLQQISPEYFVLMKPCELVSGDFYWATSFDEYQIFCVADCTGHGVPGAFMSILGFTALNNIVIRHRVTKPSDILGYLRESVIEALSQNDPEQLHKDGMDITLCTFNTKTRCIQFAGAGLHLWLSFPLSISEINIRNSDKPIIHEGFVLHEVKGDIMPVGQSPRIKPFTNIEILLPKDPVNIYLATDGFIDQFGENVKVKYGSMRLKKLILNNIEKPFSLQKRILESEFDHWTGSGKQVDDVTVLGLKII
jgi:tetratricopeptide (TPR) repeat protein